MILTSKNIAHPFRLYEAEVLQSLLDFPGGISAQGIRGQVGRMSLAVDLIGELLHRLIQYRLVDCFVGDRRGNIFYHLTVNGWLKAVALERPYSSKERT